jgi:nitrite reductase (NO-forming)
VGRNFDWVYHASGPFIFADHALVCALDPILDLPRRALPEARAVPSRGSRTISTDAEAASEAARNEADLDALFAVAVRVKPARIEAAKDAQGERGKRVYLDLCYACHQPDGQGLPGTFPMLANSDFMAADRTRAIRIVLEGLAGPVTVNGETINSVMPAQKTVLTDQQIADVLTYVFNAWENPGGAFSRAQVEVIRKGEGR